MGLAILGLEIDILCDLHYSVRLVSVILGLYFLGHALSRPQVKRPTGQGIDAFLHVNPKLPE